MNSEALSTNLNFHHIQLFSSICGENNILTLESEMEKYAHDETEYLNFLPQVVVKPRTSEEISAILKICNEEKIPVTPRGAGTGLSGGALAQLGGVLISTERMNTILEIDEKNNYPYTFEVWERLKPTNL
jgi:glycolate oxidase